MDSLADDINEKISSLRDDDFRPTEVLIKPSKFSRDLEDSVDHHSVTSSSHLVDLERDFVVCFEDEIEDSPLGLPSPDKIENKIVKNLDFHELDPEVAKRNGYDIEEGEEGLLVRIFADVDRKGVEFNEKNIEDLSFEVEDLPIEEEKKEADDSFQEPIEFAVVSSDLEDVEKDEVREAMREELKEEIAHTLYKGEFSYPFSYQESEDREPVRIGREYFLFDKVMIPENPEEDE